MSDVTRILTAIDQGDPHAAEQLLPVVYAELRQLAAQKLAQEKPGQTLEATALVHEAYLRLVDVEQAQDWNSRGHFFAAAAEAMRRILVENARRKSRLKRGGDRDREMLPEAQPAASKISDDLIALDDALTRLAAVTPRPRGWSSSVILPASPWSRRRRRSASRPERRTAPGFTLDPGYTTN